MQQSLEKLRKFFRLEHGNGYNNTAIIGGLAKMLDYWEGEARADGLTEEVIQAVVQRLRSYESLTPASRADALKGLWKRIGETYPEVGQKQQSRLPPPQDPRRSLPRGLPPINLLTPSLSPLRARALRRPPARTWCPARRPPPPPPPSTPR